MQSSSHGFVKKKITSGQKKITGGQKKQRVT